MNNSCFWLKDDVFLETRIVTVNSKTNKLETLVVLFHLIVIVPSKISQDQLVQINSIISWLNRFQKKKKQLTLDQFVFKKYL